MEATIVLIANNQTSNMASKLLLEANKIGDLGYEMTRLPFHVSLKQPFTINDLDEFEVKSSVRRKIWCLPGSF